MARTRSCIVASGTGTLAFLTAIGVSASASACPPDFDGDGLVDDRSPIDLAPITGVRFDFGGAGQSATGRIVVDDLSLLAE